MHERRAGRGSVTELAKKVPAVVAIAALAYVGVEALSAGIDRAVLVVVITAIAGLGGFYIQELIKKGVGR